MNASASASVENPQVNFGLNQRLNEFIALHIDQ